MNAVKKYISDDITTINSPLDEHLIICDPPIYSTLPSMVLTSLYLCFHDRMHIHACMVYNTTSYQMVSEGYNFFHPYKRDEVGLYNDINIGRDRVR